MARVTVELARALRLIDASRSALVKEVIEALWCVRKLVDEFVREHNPLAH